MQAGGTVNAQDLEHLYALCDDLFIHQHELQQQHGATPGGNNPSSPLTGTHFSQPTASWARGVLPPELQPQDATWDQDSAPTAQRAPLPAPRMQGGGVRPAAPPDWSGDARVVPAAAPAAVAGGAAAAPAMGAATPSMVAQQGGRPPQQGLPTTPAEVRALLQTLQERLRAEQAAATSGSEAVAERWGQTIQELLLQSMSVRCS